MAPLLDGDLAVHPRMKQAYVGVMPSGERAGIEGVRLARVEDPEWKRSPATPLLLSDPLPAPRPDGRGALLVGPRQGIVRSSPELRPVCEGVRCEERATRVGNQPPGSVACVIATSVPSTPNGYRSRAFWYATTVRTSRRCSAPTGSLVDRHNSLVLRAGGRCRPVEVQERHCQAPVRQLQHQDAARPVTSRTAVRSSPRRLWPDRPLAVALHVGCER